MLACLSGAACAHRSTSTPACPPFIYEDHREYQRALLDVRLFARSSYEAYLLVIVAQVAYAAGISDATNTRRVSALAEKERGCLAGSGFLARVRPMTFASIVPPCDHVSALERYPYRFDGYPYHELDFELRWQLDELPGAHYHAGSVLHDAYQLGTRHEDDGAIAPDDLMALFFAGCMGVAEKAPTNSAFTPEENAALHSECDRRWRRDFAY